MKGYGEFLNRSAWGPGAALQGRLAHRTLRSVFRDLDLEPTTCNLLEVGCGVGLLGLAADSLAVGSYYGVEPTPELAEVARRRLGAERILDFALPDLDASLHNRFDLVISVMVVEHTDNAAMAAEWIAAMYKCLKVGGVLVLITPDLLSYKEFFWDIDWSHGYPTTLERLEQICLSLDLKILDSTLIRAGESSWLTRFICSLVSRLIPTRTVDAITVRLFGRRLGRGIQSALFWASTRVSVIRES